MILKKNKTKNLKPIDIDGHFKYRCPNCGIDHWASFKEASTKNFIIVCDCETVFSVKRIVTIDIVYAKSKKPKQKTETPPQKQIVVKSNKESAKIPNQLLEKATKMLVALGFTNEEAIKMLTETYASSPTENITLLVKNSVAKIGGFNG